MAFTKLDSGIIDSSIWSQPLATRVVWVTILAKCGPDHIVRCSRSGLFRAANVTQEEFDEAIRILESPDDESRTKEQEGRRIVPIEGGWFVINHEKYRLYSYSDSEEAIRKRKYRERDKTGQDGTCPDMSHTPLGHSASASASASDSLSEEEEKEEEEREDEDPTTPPIFYPKKPEPKPKAKRTKFSTEQLETLQRDSPEEFAKIPAYQRIRFNRAGTSKIGTLGDWEFILLQDVKDWSETFPSVNVPEELKQARAWLMGDPSRIYINYAEFLRRWFSRTMNRGGTRKPFTSRPGSGQETASSDWAARKQAEMEKGKSHGR